MVEYRSAKFNARGTIDCELNHPHFGWIPFTAAPDDPEAFGRWLFAELVKGEVAEYVRANQIS